MYFFQKLLGKHVAKKRSLPTKSKKLLTSNTFSEVIAPKIPAGALSYCTALWKEHPFSFGISKTRSTCLGNYKYQNGHHTITVNHDLNPYNFLITYIHEVAHQKVFIAHKGKKKPPHGLEWKQNFQKLMIPMLSEDVFPKDILVVLDNHMRNPAASSTRDQNLMKALKMYDHGKESGLVLLEEVAIGQSFSFKKRKFQKLEKRRTRALCLDLDTQKKYTVPLIAEVKLI